MNSASFKHRSRCKVAVGQRTSLASLAVEEFGDMTAKFDLSVVRGFGLERYDRVDIVEAMLFLVQGRDNPDVG